MFLVTYNVLGSGNCSYTVLIDLGLAELRNVRDSVALRSYADSWSQAISDSRAWLCKSAWDKATGRERVRYLLVTGRKRLGPWAT